MKGGLLNPLLKKSLIMTSLPEEKNQLIRTAQIAGWGARIKGLTNTLDNPYYDGDHSNVGLMNAWIAGWNKADKHIKRLNKK